MKRSWNPILWGGFALVLAGIASYPTFFIRFPVTRDFPWANLLLLAVAACMLAVGVLRAFKRPEAYRGKLSGPILYVKQMNGSKILRAIGKHEDRCQKRTEKRLPRMGKKAPVCYAHLGQVLAYADMIGSCTFGCPGRSREAHAVWYLVARTSSFGRAALRLAKMGFYDEGLNLVRSIGEIANLLALFAFAPEAIEEWKSSDRSYRLQHLTPAKIRRRLVAINQAPVMDDDKYATLCEVSTHPVPELRPQQFNHAGKSAAGGLYFQEAGFLVVLNEMALVTSLLVVFAAKVCKVPDDEFREIGDACAKCARAAGRIDLASVQEALTQVKP